MEPEQTYSVLIVDMFHHDVESDYLVEGFTRPEDAREFARRWVRDSLEEHRSAGQTAEALRKMWFSFGEDALALGQKYAGSHELDYFVAHPATAEERDWQSLRPA